MERLDIELDYDGDRTTARLISDFGKGVVEQHWPGLEELQHHEQHPHEQQIAKDDDEERNPFLRFAVNSNNQEEVAVYLGLAWALTAGTERYAIPTWSRDDVARRLRRSDFDLVRWEYGIVPDESSWAERVRGFVRPANPLPLRPPPTEWQQEHHDEAGLFPVRDLESLAHLAAVTLSDMWGDLNVFGLAAPAGYNRLVNSLRAAKPPKISELLEPGDVFAIVTVGVDLGFFDSVYAVGAGDRRREWSEVIDSFRRRIEAYEATIDSVRSIEQLFAALAWLQGDLLGEQGDQGDQGDMNGQSAITYPNFHRALIENVPEARLVVEQHIADHHRHVRPHLLIRELARFVLAAHRRGDAGLANQCVRFLSHALGAQDERVVELVTASFVPAVAAVPGGRAFIATWPAALRAAAGR